jgi:hypothetical protein
MESLTQLVKGQEYELMKHLLGAKEVLFSGVGNDEILKKASEMMIKVNQKYENLKKIAEKSTDFQRKIVEKKAEAYKVKADEIKLEIERIRKRESDINSSNARDAIENTLVSSVNTQEIGINTLGKLKNQRESIQKFAAWSIKKEVNDSNSALIDLYLKKSKIKVSMVLIIILQIFIFLLVLKLKLS